MIYSLCRGRVQWGSDWWTSSLAWHWSQSWYCTWQTGQGSLSGLACWLSGRDCQETARKDTDRKKTFTY